MMSNNNLSLFLGFYIVNFFLLLLNKSQKDPTFRFYKVEYHANENPLQISEKNSICLSKANVSNNRKKTLPR